MTSFVLIATLAILSVPSRATALNFDASAKREALQAFSKSLRVQ